MGDEVRFFLLVRSVEGAKHARLLIESLRSFGGPLAPSVVWVYATDPVAFSPVLRGTEGVEVVPLGREGTVPEYPFAHKARACAQAEEMASDDVGSLVWLGTGCLVVSPPVLFKLDQSYDAALRPVHITNVGSPAREPPDDFWAEVYRVVGVEGTGFTVESFVDSQELRPYFNTHCFSVNPSKGVLRAWWEYFKVMASDRVFQSGACRDELHRVFLHQAILSALLTKLLDRHRMLILPDEYSYPLHLQQETPQSRRAAALNDLVCAAYEEISDLNALRIHEPLKSWLTAHLWADILT